MKFCKTKGCSNGAANGRNYCYACVQRKYRKNNPMRSSWNNLKASAIRRNIPFDLSYEDFKAFAIKVDYIQRKGVEKDSYHIDRIDERKGYVKSNIQVLTNSENVKKYVRYAYTEMDGKKVFKVHRDKTSDEQSFENVPF